jgi:hypothetical protein
MEHLLSYRAVSKEFWGDDTRVGTAYRQRHDPEQFNAQTLTAASRDTRWLAENGYYDARDVQINRDLENLGGAMLAADVSAVQSLTARYWLKPLKRY